MTRLLTCNLSFPLFLDTSLLKAGESRVTQLLKSKEEELHRVSNQKSFLKQIPANHVCAPLFFRVPMMVARPQLANALMEHETLDAEEVKKVIKGETIRNIKEVLAEDLSRMTEKTSS